jgi:predicted  nucleic acid-binding Zn-ribbon protein
MNDINTTDENQKKDAISDEAIENNSAVIPEEDGASRFQHYFSEEEVRNAPKLTSVLQSFLRLREIDSELAEIEEEKGDLPESIERLSSQCAIFKTDYASKKGTLNSLVDEKSRLETENTSHEEKINKYDEQKYNVRSNKEYDEITKTVDSLFEEVKKNEARLKEIDSILSVLDVEIEDLENKITEQEKILSEKQSLLDELDEQYKQEELVLRERRDSAISELNETNRFLYENVNKMYKGEAAAIVRKGNCSGCYNSIPPQRVIEIKTAEKIFTCQSCGRILVAEELIGN